MIINPLKIKFPFKAQNDQTKCLAIQGFVLSILNFDHTLSVDQPLFQALQILSKSIWISVLHTFGKFDCHYYFQLVLNFVLNL